MSKCNHYDKNEFNAFISDESKIVTDDRELDEHDPALLLNPDELDTDCMGNCFTDADPGL